MSFEEATILARPFIAVMTRLFERVLAAQVDAVQHDLRESGSTMPHSL